MDWQRAALAYGCLFVITLGWVAATPSTAIPVGIAVADGISMGQPDDDLLVYANTGDPEIGDHVIYWSDANQEYIGHRVVDKNDSGYITQGDALAKTDYEYRGDIVTDENYVGTVIVRLPTGRFT